MSLCPLVKKKGLVHDQHSLWEYLKSLHSLLNKISGTRVQTGGQGNTMIMSFLLEERQKSFENGFFDGHFEGYVKGTPQKHFLFEITPQNILFSRKNGKFYCCGLIKDMMAIFLFSLLLSCCFSPTACFFLFSFDKLKSLTNLKEQLISLHQ